VNCYQVNTYLQTVKGEVKEEERDQIESREGDLHMRVEYGHVSASVHGSSRGTKFGKDDTIGACLI